MPQYSITAFSYNPATFTATWTLASNIDTDHVQIALDGHSATGVTDTSGRLLDGEWTDNVSQYPSGNGSPGGDFTFHFNVLPGDLNQDGIVNGADITLIASHWLATGQFADTNGDGILNGQDISTIGAHWLASNPAGNARPSPW